MESLHVERLELGQGQGTEAGYQVMIDHALVAFQCASGDVAFGALSEPLTVIRGKCHLAPELGDAVRLETLAVD